MSNFYAGTALSIVPAYIVMASSDTAMNFANTIETSVTEILVLSDRDLFFQMSLWRTDERCKYCRHYQQHR